MSRMMLQPLRGKTAIKVQLHQHSQLSPECVLHGRSEQGFALHHPGRGRDGDCWPTRLRAGWIFWTRAANCLPVRAGRSISFYTCSTRCIGVPQTGVTWSSPCIGSQTLYTSPLQGGGTTFCIQCRAFCFQLCYGKRTLTLYKLGENMPVT